MILSARRFSATPSKRCDRCELVVVQHLFMTDSADFADVVLPTTAFGEERVSFTSTERRIQIAERVIDPPEGPMPAWEQLTRLARAMGADWNYESAADVMQEIGEVIPFYSGASHDNLTRDYGRQWPCTTDRPLGTALLFADGEMERPFKFVPVARPSKPFGQSGRVPVHAGVWTFALLLAPKCPHQAQ